MAKDAGRKPRPQRGVEGLLWQTAGWQQVDLEISVESCHLQFFFCFQQRKNTYSNTSGDSGFGFLVFMGAAASRSGCATVEELIDASRANSREPSAASASAGEGCGDCGHTLFAYVESLAGFEEGFHAGKHTWPTPRNLARHGRTSLEVPVRYRQAYHVLNCLDFKSDT